MQGLGDGNREHGNDYKKHEGLCKPVGGFKKSCDKNQVELGKDKKHQA